MISFWSFSSDLDWYLGHVADVLDGFYETVFWAWDTSYFLCASSFGWEKKKQLLFIDLPLLTLWPIWHCSFVMVLQHKLNDRSCDHFKDRCDLILLLTTLENHQNCTKVKMWVFRNCMNFNSFKSYFMQQSGAQRQSRALILHVLLWCTKLHKVLDFCTFST